MKRDLKYFMRDTRPETVTVPGPDSFKDESGNVMMFEIRVLSQEEINRINDSYRRRSIATDGAGNSLTENGKIVWKIENDSAKASRRLIVEALQWPDLKSPELMEYYGCTDITDMPLLVFRTAAEYQHVSRMVMQVLSPSSEISDSEELDIAKRLLSEAGSVAYWGSVLWQRHSLRIEEFYHMPRRLQLLYIASEIVSREK